MKNSKFKTPNLASPARRERLGWQDGLKERMETLSSVIESKIKTINGLVSRNGGRGLIGVLLKYVRTVHSRSSKSVVRQVAKFAFFCWRMARHSGLKGLVIYLKASQVLLQQVVGGFRVLDLAELKVRPARNRAGVPLVIPAGVRVRISRDRDIKTIRLWMTLFGLYRILEFRGKLSLKTIITKGPNISSFEKEWERFIIDVFKPALIRKVGKLPNLGSLSLFPILKSGPVTGKSGSKELVNSSAFSLILSSRTYLWSKALARAFKDFAKSMGKPAIYLRMRMVSLAHCDRLDKPIPKGVPGLTWPQGSWAPYPSGETFLGRLGFKIEPAGKIRVFAMVDAWTQWVMAPLHDWVFSILRKLPQDGTFDQMAPIRRLQLKYASSPKKKTFASLDLSAATDRLPISLQRILLKILLSGVVTDSDQFSKNWQDLLVKRAYQVAPSRHLLQKADLDFVLRDPHAVYYAVGQPMGALSSWALLALTHHALVQYAFYKAYGKKEWYEEYGVLGDDGVIVDGKVISEYRRVLQVIGVQAGLAKSIIAKSKFVIEFAKKFFVDSVQANMVPLKECIATSCSTSLVMEFVRKYELSLNQILSFLGYGFKAKMRAFNCLYFELSTRLRVLLVWLSHPSSPLGRSSYFEWLLQSGWHSHHSPSPQYLLWVVDQCRALVDLKVDRMLEIFSKYQDSLNNVDKTLDQKFPIVHVVSTESGDSVHLDEFHYSWKGVLDQDLTSQSETDFWDESFETSSSHGYRWRKQAEDLKNLKLGIDFDEIYIPAFGALQEMYDNANGPIPDQINALLTFYFEPDLITSRIPEDFWRESRETLRPFRDFSEIYRIWQDLTKPLWAEYYRGKPSPIKEKAPSNITSPVRDEPEGSATTASVPGFNPWSKAFKIIGYVFDGFNWLVAAILFWCGLWDHTGELVSEVPFLFPEVTPVSGPLSPDTAESILGIASDTGVPTPVSWIIPAYFITMGCLYIIVACWNSYQVTGEFLHIPDWVWGASSSHTDVVTRRLSEIHGPLSLQDYRSLQQDLVVDALLENLAISPIGDLWINPWL
jgi:hypothetical protein